MKKLLALLLVSNSMIVMADDYYNSDVYQPYNGAGAYMNFNAGLGTMQNAPTGSFAGIINAGYNFNRALALEGGVSFLPSEQYGQFMKYSLFDVAVKGTFPVASRWALYGRLGLATSNSSWNGDSSSPGIYSNGGSAWDYGGLAGLGISLAITRHFDLRLEDSQYIPFAGQAGNFGNVNIADFGFQYNF